MLKLKTLHLPIAMKAVTLIATLGLLSIAANAFCLQRFDALDKLNAVVTRHFVPARLALAEAKAAIESFGVATYKSYSASDPDQANDSAKEIEGHYAAAKRALNNVLTYYPAAEGDLRRIFDKLELAHTIAVNLKGAVKADKKDEAKRIVDFKFDPARDDVTGHMDRLINILGAQTRSAEAEVAERSAFMFCTTVGILVGGTIAALAIVFLLTRSFVTRPLRGMARATTLMAEGDLGVPVRGSDRGDEIGAMARAVAVFRNNDGAARYRAGPHGGAQAGGGGKIRRPGSGRRGVRRRYPRHRRLDRTCGDGTRSVRPRHGGGTG
jgi:methyl-accepting chemotaxis protein